MSKFFFSFLLMLLCGGLNAQPIIDSYGALVRSDTSQANVYLCFTGHDFYDGFDHVLKVLKREKVKASFFLTGDFIRNHTKLVKKIARRGHYVGAHSDKHLLYCDWEKRDSLLHSPEEIRADIVDNLRELELLNIQAKLFMPPYEWYNQKVVEIATDLEQVSVNFSYGTRSNADYTTPDMKNYISSQEILKSIYDYETQNGMKGFHLLIHPGVNALRTDKLYHHLEEIIQSLKAKSYGFERF